MWDKWRFYLRALFLRACELRNVSTSTEAAADQINTRRERERAPATATPRERGPSATIVARQRDNNRQRCGQVERYKYLGPESSRRKSEKRNEDKATMATAALLSMKILGYQRAKLN